MDPPLIRIPIQERVEDEIFRVALETGAQVRYLGAEARTLEEVFLQIVGGGGPDG